MKKVLFVLVLAVSLFAQSEPKEQTVQQKQQELQTQIQVLKGDISDAETARKNLYDQLTKLIAFQIQKEQQLSALVDSLRGMENPAH